MTPQQAQWAAQHDWFIADKPAHNNPNERHVVVNDIRPCASGLGYWPQHRVITDYQELREWAGY